MLKAAAMNSVQMHIDAVIAGERVEDRLALIRGSNVLDDDERRMMSYFLKSWCLLAAIYPLCGREIDLGEGLRLRLNKPSHEIRGNELPGVRIDGYGDLVIEGDYIKDGRPKARYAKNGNPLWPLILRNVPIAGAGPPENFRSHALQLLADTGKQWQSLT